MSARNSTWRTATRDLSAISTATWITPPSHANTDGELTRMVPPTAWHHHWFCSQIHSRVGHRSFQSPLSELGTRTTSKNFPPTNGLTCSLVTSNVPRIHLVWFKTEATGPGKCS
ncbi:hypothetical protein Tcan_17971 [Toxocara canis]|uniref:Uncharacterized protein n=1 Tax=Toxocara canis TaxID=6265 RepID=A0A0B2VSR2_TOXCA|nr:hypothetical protein Tcan_17971 [Toxocara canis]